MAPSRGLTSPFLILYPPRLLPAIRLAESQIGLLSVFTSTFVIGYLSACGGIQNPARAAGLHNFAFCTLIFELKNYPPPARMLFVAKY
jgi:hypothetical protein